jgi:catechol 2,3-dioxygenase
MQEALDAPAHVASVTLAVRDLAAVSHFYREVLGLTVEPEGADRVSLRAAPGEAPLLTLMARPDRPPVDPRRPGLFHTAFLLPSRAHLAQWLAHAGRLGVALEGASDHLVSEAVYLSDPEGNGIEVYVDRPRANWPREGATEAGGVAMATLPLDGAGLMAAASPGDLAGPWRFPAQGGVGHVHLRVGDLAAAEAFYRERLGMAVMARYPGAVFLSWGGYHHHIAVNVWHSRGAPARNDDSAGLSEIAVQVTAPKFTASEFTAPEFTGLAAGQIVTDPAGNRLRFVA